MASVASDPNRSVASGRRTLAGAAIVLAFISLLSISGLNLLHTPAVFDDLLMPGGATRAAFVGHGRLVRGDEYLVETPVAMSQARSGRRETMRIGTQDQMVPRSRQDADVHAYAPGPVASMVFRPLNLWFLVLPAGAAVIARHWSVLVLGLLAFSMFVRALAPGLGRAPVMALAVSSVFSPLMMWWFTTTHHLAVAFGVLAGTLLVLSGSRRRVLVGALSAGYVAGLGAVTTYPAFFLGCVLVSALCMVPVWWGSSDRVLRVLVAGAAAAVTVGSFWFANRSGLRAVFDTVYPGQRVSSAGEDSIFRAMSGPFSRSLTDDRPTGFGNQTEVASPLYLFPAALMVMAFVALAKNGRPFLRTDNRRVSTVEGTSTLFPFGAILGLGILGGWASGLLPTSVGRVIGMGGVPGARTSMGQMVACTAIGAWLVSQEPGQRLVVRKTGGSPGARFGVPREGAAFAASTVLVGFAVFGTGLGLRDRLSPSHLALREVALYTALFTASMLGIVLLRSTTHRAFVAAGLSLALSGGVHPVSVGLGPEDRLAQNLRRFAQSDLAAMAGSLPGSRNSSGGRWAAHEDVRLNAVVVASGLDSLSGVYFVPDLALWKVFDPNGSMKQDWNRYAHVVFRFGSGGAANLEPSFRAVQADAIVIDVGLCRPELARLGLRYVLSFDVLDAPCVVQQAVANPGGVHIARLRNSAAVEP